MANEYDFPQPPESEWDSVPKTPDGRPRITVRPQSRLPVEEGPGSGPKIDPTKPLAVQFSDPPEEPQDFDPWQRAATRIKQSNVGKLPTPELDWLKFGQNVVEGAKKAPQEAIKSFYETTDRRYYPPNAKYIGDDGRFYDENNEPIPDQQKPDVLPLTTNPKTQEIEFAFPGILDIANTIGSPAKGAATLGAGFIRRGRSVFPGKIPPEFKIVKEGDIFGIKRADDPASPWYSVGSTQEEAIVNFWQGHPEFAPNAPKTPEEAYRRFDEATGFINPANSNTPPGGGQPPGGGPPPPGMGHNQGPPMGGPPPQATPPAGGLAPPRQIIRGASDRKPFSWDDLYTKTIDDLHPLKVLQNKIAEHGTLTPEEHFYELARLTRGSYGRAQQALDSGTFDFHTLQNNGMSLKQVLKPVRNNLDNFEEYAVAMRDIELHQRGINPGQSYAQAQQKIAQAPPEYRAALKNLHAYQDRLLQYLGDSGILSPDAMANIRAANRNYVPFHRMMDDLGGGASSKNIKTWDPVKRIKGSDRDILSPLETIVRNTHLFIDLAEKNRALSALVDSAHRRGLNDLVQQVPRGTHPVNVQMDEVNRMLQQYGYQLPQSLLSQAPDSFAIFRPNAFRPAPDEIKVWRNGKPHLFKVDPEVANAVNGMGRQEVGMVLNALSIPARTLRAGAVLAPEFLARNLTRDQLVAVVMSKHGYKPFIDYLRGVGHMALKTQHYQDWLKSGGANSNLVTMERRYVRDQILNMKETGWYDKIKNNSNPMRFLEKASEYSEQPTRISEFIRARKSGSTKHEAGFDAREVTVDFGRRGAEKAVQALTHMTAFANPTMQGTDRFIRAIKDRPVNTMFKVGAYITLPTVMAYAYNRQDPRMKEIPRQERDTFWHYPTDDWQPITKDTAMEKLGVSYDAIPEWRKKTVDGQDYVNLGTIYKIPKPFEIGVWFGSSIERALDAYFYKHPDAFKGFAKSVMASVMPGLIPTIGLPALEAYTNYKFFTESPLVPKRLQSPKDRRFEYHHFTTDTAKMVGNIIGQVAPESQFASPIVLENYVNGWAGTLGRHTLQLLDAAIEGGKRTVATAAGSDRKPKVAAEWSEADIPLWRAFVSRMPSTGAQSIRDFYENIENSTTTKALMTRIARSSEFENEYQRDRAMKSVTEDRMAVKMAKTGVAVTRMFRALEMINNSRDLKPEEKRMAIDMMTLNIIYATSEANKVFRAAQEEHRKQQTRPPP